MLSAFANTALLLFTRTPQEEIAHKKLLGKRQVGQQKHFFQKLGQHARHLGQQSGLPFFVVDSTCQLGHTFGERLQRAIVPFFNHGFSKVIIIGNDCAELRVADIKQAAEILQNKAAVFGPARDGGVYLLGLDKTLFTQKPGFTQINWQTPFVLEELQAWCGGSENVTLTPVYADLDSAPDLKFAFYTKQLPALFLALLATIFVSISYNGKQFIFSILNQIKPSFSFRGPPLFGKYF